MPPNYRFLRASDLRRVACPASAVALLKRQANLFSCRKSSALIETAQALVSRKKNPPSTRGPSGEVRSAPHRLRRSRRPYSISVATQGQIISRPIGQKAGSGVPPAAFWLLCRRGQSNRGARGRVAPESHAPKRLASEAPGVEQFPSMGYNT